MARGDPPVATGSGPFVKGSYEPVTGRPMVDHRVTGAITV